VTVETNSIGNIYFGLLRDELKMRNVPLVGFYTDNNSRQSNSAKIYAPNGKYITLSCVEPATNNSEPRMYIRSSGWTISGTAVTPGRSDLSGDNRGAYGQFYANADGEGVDVKVTASNYIKIFRILGYK
jgi:hypothetical protein